MKQYEGRKTLISISLPKELVNLIDQKCGDVPRSLYLRKLIINCFEKEVIGDTQA